MRLPQPYIYGQDLDMVSLANVTPYQLGTWPAANRAIYRPLILPVTQRLSAVSVWCGVTGSGTFDLGVYDELGTTRLQSLGSTALVATSVNTWTLTVPMLLMAGDMYWLGMSCSSLTASFIRQGTSVITGRSVGLAQQATAHPLPSTATPAQYAAAYLPTFALTFVQ